MKTQQIKIEQIRNAIHIGRMAKMEDKLRFPYHDTNLMEIVKTHRADLPGNASFIELFDAWLKGWDLQNLEE